ncbi:hypothetical protein CCP4SC76_3020004 [Gammaproteobacteria bacterium]
METQPILYLALHSLRTLAKDVENMSSGLLHVMGALETILSPPVTKTSENQFGELLKRFDDVQASLGQLSIRMETIESRVETITKSEPPPVSESVDTRYEAQQASSVAAHSPPLPPARMEMVEPPVATITRDEPPPDSEPENARYEAQQASSAAAHSPPLPPARMEMVEPPVATITRDEPPPDSEPEKSQNEAQQANKAVVHRRISRSPYKIGPLSARVKTNEPREATIIKDEPLPDDEPEDVQNEAPQTNNASERRYPLNVRKMAVDMRKRGESTDAIILAIHKECGYAPGKISLPIMVDLWEKELDSTTKPLVQEAISPINAVVSVDLPDSGGIRKEAPHASISAPATDSKTLQLYPPEVKKLAVDMKREGKRFKEIFLAIQQECGYAPDMFKLPTILNRWERELDSSSEPQVQEVLPTSSAVVAISDTPSDNGKSSSAAVQDKPSPDGGDKGKDAPQAVNATVVPDKKPPRVYSPDVRRMAVDMKRKGESPDAIISAIHKECGYEPGKNNLTKMVNGWERELDSAGEPLAQGVVLPINTAAAISDTPASNGKPGRIVVAQDEPLMDGGNAGKDFPQARSVTAAPDNKTLRVDYPPEVRRMALNMRREGKNSADILTAIHKECGHAPDSRNLQKRLNTWEKNLAPEALPPVSEVVAQVVSAPAPADDRENALQVNTTAGVPDKKPRLYEYSPEIRSMAVDMKKQGEGTDVIIQAIHKECGYAPGKNNLPKMLNAWERDLDTTSEPVAQEAIPVSGDIEANSNSEDVVETSSTVVIQDELVPSNVDAGIGAPQADAVSAAPDKKTSRLTFPPDVRRMAVEMRRKGKSNDAIASAIHKKCGYAPDRKFLSGYLNRWENPR